MEFDGASFYTEGMVGSSKRTVSVYELVNERLREIYVGRTSSLKSGAAATAQRTPVPQIAHWDVADVRPPRHIERDLSERDADSFISAYVQTPLPDGWRFVR